MASASRKRTRAVDREEAVAAINEAYVEGQISELQREERVSRALVAARVGELHALTQDLQRDRVSDQVPAVAPGPGWWSRRSTGVKVAIGAALVAALGTTAVVAADVFDGSPPSLRAEEPYVLTASPEVVEQLVREQRDVLGTTASYGISLQQGLSEVWVPTGDGKARYQEWRPVESGGFVEDGGPRAAGELREFDLADLDLDAFEAHFEAARSTLGVPEPTAVSLVVKQWKHDAVPKVAITVVNEYEEYGYLVTDLAGKVLERHPFDASGGAP